MDTPKKRCEIDSVLDLLSLGFSKTETRKKLNLSPSAFSNHLRKLEDSGYIKRDGHFNLTVLESSYKHPRVTKNKLHNKKAISVLKKACAREIKVEVKLLPDMYPAGDERVIIRELLGVELQPGQLPLEANAVICNVETIKNIVWAIEDRRPVITKDVTVGGRLKNAKDGKIFFNVPIGTDFETLIEAAGGYYGHHGEIVAGGAFTGKSGSEKSRVTKTTGGVLVAMPFPNEKRKVGIIACECGAQEERLREIAAEMGAEVVAEKKCKRMIDDGRGRYRCELPGSCPGQAETVLYLKKQGAEVILTGTCQD